MAQNDFIDKINKYSGAAGAIGGAATTGIGMIKGMVDAYDSDDIKQSMNTSINNILNSIPQSPNQDSFDLIMNDYNVLLPQHMSASDFGKVSDKDAAFGAIGSGISGAVSGASAGGLVGGIIGGIAGIGSSIFSSSSRNKAAKKAAIQYNTAVDNAINQHYYNLNQRANNVMTNQMKDLKANAAKFGGFLNTNGADFNEGLVYIDNGGSHEENPNGGVQVGVDQEGTPNTVEEGEVIFNNEYVFSDKMKVSKDMRGKYKLGNIKSITYASALKRLSKEAEERPNDAISKNGLDVIILDLMIDQELSRAIKNAEERESNRFELGGPFLEQWNTIMDKGRGLRSIPMLGSIGLVATDMLGVTNKPDYSAAKTMEDLANQYKYTPVSYNPVTDFLSYKKLDRNHYLNRLQADAAASRRAVMNLSGGNPYAAMAGLIAADSKYQELAGELARKMEETDRQLEKEYAAYNADLKYKNEQGRMSAALMNAQNYANMMQYRSGLITQAALLRALQLAQSEAAKSTNMSNMFNNIGAYGKEQTDMGLIGLMAANGLFGSAGGKDTTSEGTEALNNPLLTPWKTPTFNYTYPSFSGYKYPAFDTSKIFKPTAWLPSSLIGK